MALPATIATHASIDAPGMRHALSDRLSLALIDARNHTLHLLAQFEHAGAVPADDMPQAQSALGIAGRIGWFAEAWTSRNTQRALGPACPSSPARLASIEPRADEWWDPSLAPGQARHDATTGEAVRAYLLETLEATLELLEKAGRGDDALYFYRLALFHEDICGEALVTLAQAQGVALKLDAPAGAQVREPLALPATHWLLGSQPGGFVFDNEKWGHEVHVPEFEIDAQPVTWSQYVEFVADGGYDRHELWLPEGWAWLEARTTHEGRRAPRYVEQIGTGSGAVLQDRFGKSTRMAGSQPVMHLTWWEADAWCRWAGRRLPAELEWEVAAHTAQRRGFRWGEVHEWTGTTFRPWPGFSADPWADYSMPAFGRAKVRRGASFATRSRMKHPKFRGFALADRDDAFVGFRSCAL